MLCLPIQSPADPTMQVQAMLYLLWSAISCFHKVAQGARHVCKLNLPELVV